MILYLARRASLSGVINKYSNLVNEINNFFNKKFLKKINNKSDQKIYPFLIKFILDLEKIFLNL